MNYGCNVVGINMTSHMFNELIGLYWQKCHSTLKWNNEKVYDIPVNINELY